MKDVLKIAVVFLFWSCAQQAPLTGGIKDTIPPEIINFKSYPKNLSTNFQSNNIRIEFDEYIKLKNTSKNFFVNPPIEDVAIKAANKSILITINEELKAQTTYTFNFGSAIEDITEGNVLEDFKYVVSTGNYIDSNFFDGFAFDAFSKKPIENTKIFLFENLIDTFSKQKLPNYLSSVKEDGSFSLKNLTNQPFYLVAFEDENDNNSFDYKTEKIGFLKENIYPINKKDSTVKPPTVLLFSPEKKLKLIDKKYLYPGKVLLLFNKKTASVSVTSAEKKLIVVNREYPSDSLEFWIDSISSKILNATISSDFLDSAKTFSITTSNPEKTDSTFTFRAKNLSNLKPKEPLRLHFNHPISTIDTSKITLLKDSIAQPINFSFSANVFSLFLPNGNKGTYNFDALPGAFNSIYGFTNDSTTISIQPKKSSDYGSIYFSVSVEDSTNFICQVIKKNKVVKAFYCSKGLLKDTVQMCLPGNYNIRVIKDSDKDGAFSTGNFLQKKLAEQVLYYNQPIEIKAGWDVEINWKIK